MNGFSFDPQQYEPQYGGGGSLPEGEYKVIISHTAIEPAASNPNNGKLVLTYKVVEGPLTNQEMKDNLNIYNQNVQSVEIAQKQLSAIAFVVGQFTKFDHPDVLKNRPFMIRVGLQKEPNPNKYVEVKAVMDINGNPAGKAGAGPQAAQAPAAAPPPLAPQQPQATGAWPVQAASPAPAQEAPQPAQAPSWPQPGNGAGVPPQPAQAPAWPAQPAPAQAPAQAPAAPAWPAWPGQGQAAAPAAWGPQA